MKTHTLLILSLLFLLFADSCKKKCSELPPYLIEQEMKDWLFFQPGSYWIYKDTITGLRDSVYVTESSIEFIKEKDYPPRDERKEPCPPAASELMEVYISSYLTSGSYLIWGHYPSGSGVQNNTNPVKSSAVIENLNHSGGDGGFSKYMFFPVLQGTKGAWNGYTIIEHDTIYKQYELNGQNYENVLRVSDGLNGAYNAITKFYNCKHIGVIKKEIYRFKDFNDKDEPELLHVWELVKYEVNQ